MNIADDIVKSNIKNIKKRHVSFIEFSIGRVIFKWLHNIPFSFFEKPKLFHPEYFQNH